MTSPGRQERRGTARELGEAFATMAEALLERGMHLEDAVEAFSSGYVRSALARYNGNLSQAAAALGIHRNTLRARLQRDGGRVRRGT